MRESKEFGKRTKALDSDLPKKKYFLVCEGEKTEIHYFNSFNREILQDNLLVDLIPITRDFSEKGLSNPSKILDTLIKRLEEKESGKLSYETLLNRVIDYLKENGLLSENRISGQSIWKYLLFSCKSNGKNLEDLVEDIESACKFVVEKLEEYDIKCMVKNLQEIINDNNLTYDKNLDSICIVVDRDKDSFTKEQYQDVLDKCKEKGFELYVSNPCFEFWLLLHFNDAKHLDKDKLKENACISNKKRYAEHELCNRLHGYKKGNKKVKELVSEDKIKMAIENEKVFCEDIEQLEYSVGCNIGLLISKMWGKQKTR